MFGLEPWHIAIVVIVAIVLFGSKKLPDLGKGLGEGLKGFKEGLKGINDDTPAAPKPPVVTEQAHVVTPKPETPVEPIK